MHIVFVRLMCFMIVYGIEFSFEKYMKHILAMFLYHMLSYYMIQVYESGPLSNFLYQLDPNMNYRASFRYEYLPNSLDAKC